MSPVAGKAASLLFMILVYKLSLVVSSIASLSFDPRVSIMVLLSSHLVLYCTVNHQYLTTVGWSGLCFLISYQHS